LARAEFEGVLEKGVRRAQGLPGLIGESFNAVPIGDYQGQNREQNEQSDHRDENLRLKAGLESTFLRHA